jgi:hypothetical protein
MYDELARGLGYPGQVQVSSAMWIVTAVVVLLLVSVGAARFGIPFHKPLRLALRLGIWNVGLWTFFFSAFAVTSQPPIVLHWLWTIELPLDFIRECNQWFLWHTFGVVVVSSPVSFFNGSSSWHAHPTVIALGLVNDTLFVIIVTYAMALLVSRRRRLQPRKEPSNQLPAA